TIGAAGTRPEELSGIFLAGGSSRIPLVQRMVAERFGSNVQMIDEPKTVVARGAAVADQADVEAMATHMTASSARPAVTPTDTASTATAPPAAKDEPRRRELPVLTGRALAAAAAVAILAAAGIAYGVTRPSGKHPAAASTTVSQPATTVSRTPTTIGSVGGGTTPYLGIAVAATGGPVKGKSGQQLTVSDPNGTVVPLTGVEVTAVADQIRVGGANRPSPASAAGIQAGDIIWGVSQVTSSQYTTVVSGTTVSSFMREYATTGATDAVYIYFYEPSTGINHSSDPVQLHPAAVSQVAAANINCVRSC
ncbi:MAG TPA: Hsp70 family protein, partial [Acidimicrobiales bacterium]|nr:Hsp70 family protein [Acidimicrobiales bacterium]